MGPSTSADATVTAPERLHIAFVSDCLDIGNTGGVISAHRFAEHLAHEHELFVIGTAAKGFACVPMVPLRLPIKRYTEMGFVFAKPNRPRIAQALAHADIVHLQFPFWLSFVALDEAKKLGKPVVAAMHVQPENFLFNVGLHSPYLAGKMYDYAVQFLYNKVDAVICPTDFAADKLRAHGLTTPAHIISNGYSANLETGRFTRDPADTGFFQIVCIGRYSWDKRQDVLIDAARRSRHADRIKLVIGGAGPREAELRARAEGLPHAPEFGYLTQSRMRQVLNTADLFVHCGEVELEGMSVLDSMSVGLPTIIAESSESAASRFALDDRFAFPAGDSAVLAQRIDMWIDNVEALHAARQSTRDFAHQFEFTKNADKLSGIYRDLVARSKANRQAGSSSLFSTSGLAEAS